MNAHGDVGLLPSRKIIELYEMIDMIVRKNLPIGITDDADYRYVSYKVHIWDHEMNYHLLLVALFIVACTGTHSSTITCFCIN